MASFAVPARAHADSCRVITFPNEKGGTGKTTTAWGFAYGLAGRGLRILVIDLDGQGPNLSFLVGADKVGCMGSYEMLSGQAPAADCMQRVGGDGGFDIVAANNDVRNVIFDRGDISALFRLKEAVEAVRGDYDFILIDAPTGFSELIANAYIAADDLIIPAEADFMSAEGINGLTANIAKTTAYANPEVRIAGIVIGNFRGTTNFQADMREGFSSIGANIGTRVFERPVRQSIRIQEAQARHESIFAYAPGEPVSEDFAAVVDEYLKLAM